MEGSVSPETKTEVSCRERYTPSAQRMKSGSDISVVFLKIIDIASGGGLSPVGG